MKSMKRFFSKAVAVFTVVSITALQCATVSFAADYDLTLNTPTQTVVSDNGTLRRNVTVGGTLEGVAANTDVVITVSDAAGAVKMVSVAKTDANGAFSKVFGFPDDDAYVGTYTFRANATLANEKAEKTFAMTRVGTTAVLNSISAKGVNGTIVEEAGTSKVSITVPASTDLTAVVLTFATSGNAALKSGSTTLVSGETALDFTMPLLLTVVSETGTVTKDYAVTVTKQVTPGSTGTPGSTIVYPTGGNSGGSTTTVTPSTKKDDEKKVSFTDLDTVSWAEESIVNLAKKGVISGRSETIFDPNGLVTREEYAKMLVLAFGLKADNATCNFSDVAPSDWYYEYVAIASARGIVNGFSDGRFGVGETITRQDMAVMTYRAKMAQGQALKMVNAPITFADVDEIASYATEAVTVMQRAGIINGMGGNRFEPNGTATRAQAARIIDLVTR